MNPMNGEQCIRFKIASEESEFEQIFRLNYKTFVEELPQHPPNLDLPRRNGPPPGVEADLERALHGDDEAAQVNDDAVSPEPLEIDRHRLTHQLELPDRWRRLTRHGGLAVRGAPAGGGVVPSTSEGNRPK